MEPKRLSLKQLPESERPREKLSRHGEESLSDAELIAIILGSGSRSETAVQLSQRLLKEVENLKTLASMSIRQLCQIYGIGPAKAAQLKAALELSRRLAGQASATHTRFLNSRTVFQYFQGRLSGRQQEEFWVIVLDAKNHFLKECQVFKGSLMGSLAHPREVFQFAIKNSAAGIILLHNHPSGDPNPSPEDHKVTLQLAEAGKLLGIPVLDHIIIGNDSYYSFKDAGIL